MITKHMIAAVVVAAFALTSAGSVFAQAAPAWKCAPCHDPLSKALPANHKSFSEKTCATCHKAGGKGGALGKIVHTAHLAKKPDLIKDCLGCHTPPKGEEGTYAGEALAHFFTSWMSSSFLDNVHKEKGVYCTDCHKNYIDPFEARETQDQCIKCHGDYDALLKSAKKSTYEKNPHKSHYVDLRCNLCHKGHSQFTDYCAQCHQFGYKWEKKKGAAPGGK